MTDLIPTCPGCYLPMSDRHHIRWWGTQWRAYCTPEVESPITDQQLLSAIAEGQPA